LNDSKLKIGKKSLYVFICTLIAFQPISLSYLGVGKILSDLQDFMYLFLLVVFVFCKLKGYWSDKVSVYIKLVLLFDTLYFISTYINVGFNSGIITYAFKKFTLLCWSEHIIKHKKYKLLRVMANVLWILIIIDFITIIIYPNGLESFGIYGWFLGEKNNHITYIFLASLLNLIDWYVASKNKKKKIMFKMIILEVIGIATVVLVKSSTSTITICVLVSFIVLYPVLKLFKSINMYAYMIIHTVIWSCIVIYNEILADVLSRYIGSLVGKDATFTGRVPVWNSLLSLIKDKPLMGYGFRSVSDNIKLTGIPYYLNAHDQVLELLYTGGSLLLVTFIILIFLCLGRNHKKRSVINILAAWSIFALLFEFTQETIMQDYLLWMILLVIYHANEIGDYRYELFYKRRAKKKCHSGYEGNSNFNGVTATCVRSNG
jgi:O-antigen ligase